MDLKQIMRLNDAISKWGGTCMREHYHLCEAPFSQYLFFLRESAHCCIKSNTYSENISPSCEYIKVRQIRDDFFKPTFLPKN